MKMLSRHLFGLWLPGVLGVALLLGVAGTVCAQGGPVKVTIQHENTVVGEGATLPIDPTPRVHFGYQPQMMMPGLAGPNGERLTISPQGGHQMMMQIDGQISIIGQPPGMWQTLAKQLPKSAGGKQRVGVTSTWVVNKIHVTQVIELIPSKAPPKAGGKRQMDVMLLKYTIENKDTIAHQVGVRNTIDIYLINNDGALFASPLTHPGKIINGHEFKGDKLPDYVQVLQNPDLKNPGYVTHFSFKLGKLEPPTRFVCTNLGACFMGGWDVPAQPAGDSAVAIFFDPKAVAPGGKREMAYAYGIGVASNPENEGRVTLQMGGSFEVGKQFNITAYVEDPLESQSLTLQLPPGLELVQGHATQAVPPADDTGSAVVVWKARVTKLGSHALKIRSSNGVEYTTKLTIEEAPKGTTSSVLIQPLPDAPAVVATSPSQSSGSPSFRDFVAKLKAKGDKTAIAYEKLLLKVQAGNAQLEESKKRSDEQRAKLANQEKALKEATAALGADNAKVKELRALVEKASRELEEHLRLVAERSASVQEVQQITIRLEAILQEMWQQQGPQFNKTP
jgi:hypothetical protein